MTLNLLDQVRWSNPPHDLAKTPVDGTQTSVTTATIERVWHVIKQLFFSLCVLAFPAGAHAEKADSERATDISADQMTYDDVKQVNNAIGNVILTRGSLVMKAARVVLTKDRAGYQYATLYAAPGTLATFRQKRDGGPNLWLEAEAERIEYDDRTELVRLFSKSKLRRLAGVRPTDEMEGEFISYDSRAEFMTVNNSQPGAKAGTGRIKAVIQPRIETSEK